MTRPDFKRILIIATRQIGDVLCTTPLMHRTRELWPDAVIDVLGYEKTMGMLVGNPDVNEVIESPEHPKWPEYKPLIKRIFRRYDLAIVTQPSDRAHIYGLLAAPQRVGVIPTDWRHNWWKRLFCLETIEIDYWSQHVIVERLRLVEVFLKNLDGDRSKTTASVVPPGAEALPQSISDFLASGRVVVIHATPMWRFKRWPSDNWAKLIIHLVKSGRRVVLTGSANEQDRELNGQILQLVASDPLGIPPDHLMSCAGLLTFGQTTNLLKNAECYVGVDTSVTHLAAACGTPTIGLFGATPPTNFGPWPVDMSIAKGDQSIWSLLGEPGSDGTRVQIRGNVKIVQGPGECVPCRKAGCLDRFESRSECLDRLPVASVVRLLPK
jgi:heptosyltransferase-3